MNKGIIKLLWRILKDERGALANWALDWAAATKRGKAPSIMDQQWANTTPLQGTLSGSLLGKVGKPSQYQYNPAFDIQQPTVEKAAENTILGRLGNLPTAQDYKAKVEASTAQQIANEKTRAEAQKTEENNMYNRLGLASSTPWMTRAGELGEESLSRQKDIQTGMDIYGLDYGLNAEKAMSDIGAQWSGLGSVLGGQQAGYQKYGQQMTMTDLERQAAEEQANTNAILAYLGRGAATPGQAYDSRMFQWQQPNTWDWLSAGNKAGEEDVSKILAMLGMGG